MHYSRRALLATLTAALIVSAPAAATEKPAAEAPPAAAGEKPGAGATAAGSATAGRLQACGAPGSVRTAATGPVIDVIFVNNSDGVRGILWIDGYGIPRDYETLDPGQAYTQSTYGQHVWMITDGPGNCLAIYIAADTDATVTLTGSGGDFGPE
ncbi:MAG: hypothetical protein KIS96_09830 [Bauldia sp.]|nr:hypothetical protein [Bauldia sp.]